MHHHSTILAITFGFLVINLFVNSQTLLYFIIIISGLSLLFSTVSIIIESIWLKLALLLSKIVPNILLSVVFFLILTPLSILSKMFKAKTDFISINNQKTIFKTETREFKKDSFKKTW
tara:strand:- start:343 stop:696 length:354 start_codon:yes stop_codon:yes gene_type:complete